MTVISVTNIACMAGITILAHSIRSCLGFLESLSVGWSESLGRTDEETVNFMRWRRQ